MNLVELSRLTGMPMSQICKITGKGPEEEDFELADVNPLLALSDPPPLEHVTVEQAAELSGYSVPYIYKLMTDGTIPFAQVGHRRYPYLETLPLTEQGGPSRQEIVDKWMKEDPALRLHVLQEYGIEDILLRLAVIEHRLSINA